MAISNSYVTNYQRVIDPSCSTHFNNQGESRPQSFDWPAEPFWKVQFAFFFGIGVAGQPKQEEAGAGLAKTLQRWAVARYQLARNGPQWCVFSIGATPLLGFGGELWGWRTWRNHRLWRQFWEITFQTWGTMGHHGAPISQLKTPGPFVQRRDNGCYRRLNPPCELEQCRFSCESFVKDPLPNCCDWTCTSKTSVVLILRVSL